MIIVKCMYERLDNDGLYSNACILTMCCNTNAIEFHSFASRAIYYVSEYWQSAYLPLWNYSEQK